MAVASAQVMTAAEKRKLAVKIAKKRLKLNTYTQGSKRKYVGGYPQAGDGVKGFSDCSSFVRWVMQQVLGWDIGYNTSAQITNRAKGLLVEKATVSQTYPTEALLELGDLIYWKGTPSHTWGVGHVEMYIGNGQCIGHGSGTGPTIKNLKSYSKNRGSGSKGYLCVIRWILDDDATKLGDVALKAGDKGPMVAELQKLLKGLGYDLGKWGANRDGIDGEYGSDTKRAVKDFETACGLPADGIADVACIGAIKRAAGVGQDKDEGVKLGDVALKVGDKGPMVAELQKLLKGLGYDLGKWGANRDGIDGEYGADTKRAVKAFEASCGLPADGIADVACIEAIKRAAGVGLGKVRVTGGTVNIRSAANTDNTPLGTVKKGTLLDRTGNDTEHWYGVRWNGKAAYISAKYAEVIQ